MRPNFIVTARDQKIVLGAQTKIMGIINVTPDSFSQDGCMRPAQHFHDRALRLALKQVKDGAGILDIGGESTRPGASRVDAQEEIRRVIPVIRRLAAHPHLLISIDTNKAVVARAALDAGAHLINNIKGTKPNTALLKMTARYNAGIVLMHMGAGTPRIMQKKIQYKNIISDIINSLKESIEKCLEIGIKSDKIIIDPGFGFGKTVEHNLILLNRLSEFQKIRKPLLIGTSRKSFIGHTLKKDVHKRLMGTAATVAIGIQNGAHIVRVHDVKAITDVVRMTDSIHNEKAADYA